MTSATRCELPKTSFLRKYEEGPGYTDCYAIDVACPVSQAAFVEAFYTTWLFKIERAILGWVVRRPSTDLDAKRLAAGSATSFAAWRVEERSAEQLLLADFTGRTHSWLMAQPGTDTGTASGAGTRLYFGSAVASRIHKDSGSQRMGIAFHALLGFHRLYSRHLLEAAKSRVVRGF